MQVLADPSRRQHDCGKDRADQSACRPSGKPRARVAAVKPAQRPRQVRSAKNYLNPPINGRFRLCAARCLRFRRRCRFSKHSLTLRIGLGGIGLNGRRPGACGHQRRAPAREFRRARSDDGRTSAARASACVSTYSRMSVTLPFTAWRPARLPVNRSRCEPSEASRIRLAG
jgi:hypothetical protein